jgi:uncharacterized DUF497 family protein
VQLLNWTWDPDKNRTNQQKHGIDFETGAKAFDDPYTRTVEDPYPYEQRWRTTGRVDATVLMIVHTWPSLDPETGNEAGRIITVRRATRHERRDYEESQP